MAERSPDNVITETIAKIPARFIQVPGDVFFYRPPDQLTARAGQNVTFLAVPVDGMNLATFLAFGAW